MPCMYKILVLATGIFSSLSACADTAECRNEWTHPSSQTMTLDSAISFQFTDYKNGERHFSITQGGQSVEIYYLKGAVLVKGYTQDQLEQMPKNTLFMMPMTFFVPISILSELTPSGPCNIKEKLLISTKLSGMVGLQGRRFTGANGQLKISGSNDVAYDLDVSIDPPEVNKKSVRYSGTMLFEPKLDFPPNDTDVSDFLVIKKSDLSSTAYYLKSPTSLGELRRQLTMGVPNHNPEVNPDAIRPPPLH